MWINWYWWGFRLYADDAHLHQLMLAVQQGKPGVESYLKLAAREVSLSWLTPVIPLVSALVAQSVINWGQNMLPSTDSNCSHRGVALSIPWTVWSSNVGCR